MNQSGIEKMAGDYRGALENLNNENASFAVCQTRLDKRIVLVKEMKYSEGAIDGKNAPERKTQEDHFIETDELIIGYKLDVVNQLREQEKAKVEVEYWRMMCSLQRALLYSQSGKEV